MKKLFCIFAAAVIAAAGISAFSGCGSAEVSFSVSGDGSYYIVSGVTGSKFSLRSYDIPSSYDDGVHGLLPVKEIGEEAFMYCSLYHVTIPDGITSIGDRAFAYTYIDRADIPDSVSSIGYAAFAYCSGLTSVTVPSSVTELGGYAFAYCSSLVSAEINAQIETLEVGTLRGIVANDSSGTYANTSLTSVSLPATLKKIDRSALADNFITDIYFAGTFEEWQAIDIFYMSASEDGAAEEVVLTEDERNLFYSSETLTIHCSDADAKYSYTEELQPDNSYKVVGETILTPVK